jgi:hypothetical protein
MRRARVYIAVGFAAFVFLGLSGLLARALTGAGTERSQVLELLEAQARGDVGAVLDELPACRAQPACAEVMRDRVQGLRRPGEVEILTYSPSVQVALTTRTGLGRVAWRAGGSTPVVQCVRVRREGPLTGADVELLAISAPIGGDESCPT